MAAKQSERVKQLIDGFMELHERDMSIPEIAEHFHLSYHTVYNHLEEIAKANNVKRNELLMKVQKSHDISSFRTLTSTNHVDPKDLQLQFDSILCATDNIIKEIENVLATCHENDEIDKEEK